MRVRNDYVEQSNRNSISITGVRLHSVYNANIYPIRYNYSIPRMSQVLCDHFSS